MIGLLYFMTFPILPSTLVIPSFCSELPAFYCPSQGLTRGLHAALMGDFQLALIYNEHALHVLFFFLAQSVMRWAAVLKIRNPNILLVSLDALLSIVMFVFVFSRFVVCSFL